MQGPSRPSEEQQPAVKDVVQKVQYNLLILICSNKTVPLIRLYTQHTEGLLPKEVHSFIRQHHPGFDRGILGDAHSPGPSIAHTPTVASDARWLSHEDSAGGKKMKTEGFSFETLCLEECETREE